MARYATFPKGTNLDRTRCAGFTFLTPAHLADATHESIATPNVMTWMRADFKSNDIFEETLRYIMADGSLVALIDADGSTYTVDDYDNDLQAEEYAMYCPW